MLCFVRGQFFLFFFKSFYGSLRRDSLWSVFFSVTFLGPKDLYECACPLLTHLIRDSLTYIFFVFLILFKINYIKISLSKYFYVKNGHVCCASSLSLTRSVSHGYILVFVLTYTSGTVCPFSVHKFVSLIYISVCLICKLLRPYGQFVLVCLFVNSFVLIWPLS